MDDRKRTDCHFSVGDQVLLKLQPYTQSTVALSQASIQVFRSLYSTGTSWISCL